MVASPSVVIWVWYRNTKASFGKAPFLKSLALLPPAFSLNGRTLESRDCLLEWRMQKKDRYRHKRFDPRAPQDPLGSLGDAYVQCRCFLHHTNGNRRKKWVHCRLDWSAGWVMIVQAQHTLSNQTDIMLWIMVQRREVFDRCIKVQQSLEKEHNWLRITYAMIVAGESGWIITSGTTAIHTWTFYMLLARSGAVMCMCLCCSAVNSISFVHIQLKLIQIAASAQRISLFRQSLIMTKK